MLTVGITGGTGSGKTTILELLKKEFLENDIGFISQDSYYNDNGKLSFDEKNKINFDHPDAIDFELIINHLNLLKNKKNSCYSTTTLQNKSSLNHQILIE